MLKIHRESYFHKKEGGNVATKNKKKRNIENLIMKRNDGRC